MARELWNGSHVHLLPIDEGGTQLYPDGPHAYAADNSAWAVWHRWRRCHTDGTVPKKPCHAPQYRPRSTRFRAGST
jgi:hypothetical protein